MSKPEFKNRENKMYKTEDGPIWFSRSVAVLGILLFTDLEKKKSYVLAEKRGPEMDAPGKWCVPCGYLDWDETGLEALEREIYEETGLYLPDLKPIQTIGESQPFYVHTQPGENRQNVTLAWANSYFLDRDEKVTKKVWAAEKFKTPEIEEIKMISTDDLGDYDWAFNHDERIIMALLHHGNLMTEKMAEIIFENSQVETTTSHKLILPDLNSMGEKPKKKGFVKELLEWWSK
jgi:8-oxo-dGTP pyrophosphatase MutT (NUDIX family)